MGEGCALSMDSNGRQGKGSVHAGRCRGSGETSFCRVLAVTGATCISSFNPHNDPGGGRGTTLPVDLFHSTFEGFYTLWVCDSIM